MNKVKEFLIALGEVIKEMKKLPLKVNKWLFISTSFVVPLVVSILASHIMDVNSREFSCVTLPLFANTAITLIMFLHAMIKANFLSKKEFKRAFIFAFLYAILSLIIYYKYILH